MTDLKIGDIVEATYNSVHVGKIVADKGNFWLVEILAVLKHPMQGDLHHPGEVEGVAFHERKALAFREKANVRKRFTERYEGEIPSYAESLKHAVETYKSQLQKEDTAIQQTFVGKNC